MNNLPLVTVVTGYYNRKENLKSSIQSILDQTYTNFEFIIFDDCSTDGTYELLQLFDDPRIKLIRHEQNEGFTKGITNALKHAKGDFIAVNGAGDISRKERLAKQVAVLLDNEKIGVVSCDREEFSENKRWQVVNRDNNIVWSKGILYRNYIVHGDVMFRKSVYDLVGGYDPIITYAQDRDLWVRMRNKCDFYRIPEILYERGVYSESVSQNLEKRIQQRYFTCFSRERELKGKKFSIFLRDKYQSVSDEALIFHYTNRENKSRHLLLSICYNESNAILNKAYVVFNQIPVLNRLIYKLVVKKIYRKKEYLDEHYREMDDYDIYRYSVLK